MSLIAAQMENSVQRYLCDCICHVIGVPVMKASNPPQPCCLCSPLDRAFKIYGAHMNDTESQAIWKALAEMQAQIKELSTYGKVEFAKIQEKHVRQIDENRAVASILEDLQSKVKALCKTEEMRWRNGYAQFVKDLSPESLE